MLARCSLALRSLLVVCAAAFFFAGPAGAVTPSVAVGYYHSCAVEGSGTLKCFGQNDYAESTASTTSSYVTPTTIDLGAKVLEASAGGGFSCALLDGGAVKCWGAGEYGALGQGNTDDSPTPVTVDLGGPAKAISGGAYATCAILVAGNVKCWGYGDYGQLGNGSYSDSPTPVDADLGGRHATSIILGYSKACAIVEDGGLWCWGENYYDDIDPAGPDYVATPTHVDLGAPVTDIASDYEHNCAIVAGGTVKCWGANYDSQLGDGGTTESPTPLTVNLGEPAVKIVAGWYHTCAQLQSGTVKCWGDNELGQVSSDSTAATVPTPTDYDAGSPIREIFGGEGTTCAALVNGELKCSGYYVPYYTDPSAGTYYRFGALLITGVDMSLPAAPAPAGPSTIAGKIAKPKWKLSRKDGKITASATLNVTAGGMDATHCDGFLQVSVPQSKNSGTGKSATAPSFRLAFANGKCTAKAKRTIPSRVARKGARLKVYLKSASLLTAAAVTTTTKLPK